VRVHRVLLALLLSALPLAIAASARADAVVVVQLKDAGGHPANGTVTLTSPSGGAARSCRAQGGRCQIASVPGGRYVVTVAPAQGAAPPATSAMIPPNGTATLIVRTGR